MSLQVASLSKPTQKPHKGIVNAKILCLGISSLDTIATLSQFPSPDDKVRSTSLIHAGGGNAANTAVALSRLYHHLPQLQEHHWEVDLCSAIGNDGNGNIILDELKREQVGVEFVERYDGTSPWSYIMIVDDTRTIIHQPATRDLSVEYVISNLMDSSPITTFSTSSLNQYGALHFDVRHPEAAVYLAKKCQILKIPYSVDVERPREGLLELLSGASIVICNNNYIDLALEQEDVINQKRDDAENCQENEIVKKFKKIFQMQAPNAKIAVMTMGSKGSCLIILDEKYEDCDKEVKHGHDENDVILNGDQNIPFVTEKYGALWCETFRDCDVVDTTGAGDAYIAGFLSAIWAFPLIDNKHPCNQNDVLHVSTNKRILSHAMRIASSVASKQIGSPGARDGLPRYDNFIESEFLAMSTLKD